MSMNDDGYRNPFAGFELGAREGKVMNAVINKNMDKLKELIAQKAEIDFTITDHTPLMTAIQDGSFEFADVLMQAGANILAKNRLGFSVTHFAVKSKNLELVEKLASLKHFVVESQNDKLETPLFVALQEKNINMFEKLISLGANVNHINKKGETLLGLVTDPELDDFHKVAYAPFQLALEQAGAVMPEQAQAKKDEAIEERSRRQQKEIDAAQAPATPKGPLSSIRKKGM